jgi:hypothetical protein
MVAKMASLLIGFLLRAQIGLHADFQDRKSAPPSWRTFGSIGRTLCERGSDTRGQGRS